LVNVGKFAWLPRIRRASDILMVDEVLEGVDLCLRAGKSEWGKRRWPLTESFDQVRVGLTCQLSLLAFGPPTE
jgi:hypothetical protein